MSTVSPAPTIAGTWDVDPKHSSVDFQVKHMGIATVRGTFNDFEGTLALPEDLAAGVARGTVQVASVDTNEPQRDDHLRSPDFFDAATHPAISFTSTRIEPTGADTFRIAGDLTMHGVTNEITLEAEVNGTDVDPWGNDRVGLEVHGELSRSDYDMKFNQALGSGNVLVSDKVRLHLELSAVRRAA